jgi:hypothetical protein
VQTLRNRNEKQIMKNCEWIYVTNNTIVWGTFPKYQTLFSVLEFRLSQRWLWRVSSSRMWYHIVRWKTTYIPCFLFSFTLKIEAICSSETSFDFHHYIKPCIPRNKIVHCAIALV